MSLPWRKAGNALLVAVGAVALCSAAAVAFAVGPINLAGTADVRLDTPKIASLPEKTCIEDAEFMRSSHMALLSEWQDAVVRDGASVYESASGQVFDMSLDKTCLSCHSNPKEFCDACHARSSVELSCWQCHGQVEGDKQSAANAKEGGAPS